MGSVFASLAFKAFEFLYTTYEKKYGGKTKTQRELTLEKLLKKQDKLLKDAKAYCAQCREKMELAEARLEVAEERAKIAEHKHAVLEKLIRDLSWRPVDPNPF